MCMHVFVNNREYPTEYIQHLCYNTLKKNCFLNNNISSIIKKEVGLKWENKMLIEVV